MNFPEKLYNLRTSNGLSQKKLAEKTGVSQASINYWEKGQRTPSINAVTKLAQFFQIDVSELLNPELYQEESTIPIGNNIKMLREEQGYSLDELSKMTTIPVDTLEQYESNLKTPKNINILKLASALDPSGNRLLGDEDLPFALYVPGDNIENMGFMRALRDREIRPSEVNIITYFRELNELGQQEAEKRVGELTEIIRYLKISHSTESTKEKK